MLKSIISIPYGSIKSDPAKEQPSAVVVFQFLMVRLKAVALTQVTRLIFKWITEVNGTAKVQKNRQCKII